MGISDTLIDNESIGQRAEFVEYPPCRQESRAFLAAPAGTHDHNHTIPATGAHDS
jgi:hypothetical protein